MVPSPMKQCLLEFTHTHKQYAYAGPKITFLPNLAILPTD